MNLQRWSIVWLSTVLLLGTGQHLWGQCTARSFWFPHSQTPQPINNIANSNCNFHQWSWQAFLWATKPSFGGRIELLDLPTEDDLFAPGRRLVEITELVQAQWRNRPLMLLPRTLKQDIPPQFADIRQAMSNGVLVDSSGQPVYYAIHFTRSFIILSGTTNCSSRTHISMLLPP